jgi:MFS family permease/quinol monooxygenase YgiN
MIPPANRGLAAKLGERSPALTIGVLTTSALGFSLLQVMLLPALPAMMRALHTDANGIAWAFTSYLIAAAVSTPVLGRLGDMYGPRRLLIIALTGFAVGSVICAIGHTLPSVVIGRAIQGLGGAVLPLSFSIIRASVPPRLVATGVGVVSATLGVGAGAGLVIGGLITDHLSYEWIFWLGALSAAVPAVLVRRYIPALPGTGHRRLDIRGALLFGLALVMLLTAVSSVSIWGWASVPVLTLFASGAFVLALWVPLELATQAPFVNLLTLRSPTVLRTNVVAFLIGFMTFGAWILAPQLAQAPTTTGYGFGLTATQAGVLLLPGSLAMVAAGCAAGHFVSRTGTKVPLVLGTSLTTAAVLALAFAHTSIWDIVLLTIILFAGIGYVFTGIPNVIVESAPRNQIGEATGLNTLFRYTGQAVGAQVTATVLASTTVAGATTARGITVAYIVCAGVGAVGVIVSALIPGSAARSADAPTEPRKSSTRVPTRVPSTQLPEAVHGRFTLLRNTGSRATERFSRTHHNSPHAPVAPTEERTILGRGTMTIAIVELRVSPDSLDAAVAALNASLDATRAFDGNLGADVLQSADEPAQLLILERWETADHQKNYLAWRAGPGANDAAGQYITTPPVIQLYEER